MGWNLSHQLHGLSIYPQYVDASLGGGVRYAVGSDVDRCGAWGRGLRHGFDAIDRTRWYEFEGKAIE